MLSYYRHQTDTKRRRNNELTLCCLLALFGQTRFVSGTAQADLLFQIKHRSPYENWHPLGFISFRVVCGCSSCPINYLMKILSIKTYTCVYKSHVRGALTLVQVGHISAPVIANIPDLHSLVTVKGGLLISSDTS